jgi:hypothetical protein
MLLRVFSFLILILFFTCCDKFPFTRKDKSFQLDTLVDYSSVDFSPSFKVCYGLIDKKEKADCFRSTIHKKIGVELQQYTLSIKDSIDETIFVDILITRKGAVIFQEITSTENLKQQLPQLDSLLRQSIQKLPYIYPAIKRGIPVNTMYKLPIRILFKD